MKVITMVYSQKNFVPGKWAVLVPKNAHILITILLFDLSMVKLSQVTVIGSLTVRV